MRRRVGLGPTADDNRELRRLAVDLHFLGRGLAVFDRLALALVEPLLPHRLLHRLLHLRCTLPLKRLAEAHQRQAAPRGIVGIPHDARYGLVGEGNLQVQRKDGLQRLGNADVGNRLGRFFHGRRTRDDRIPKPKE